MGGNDAAPFSLTSSPTALAPFAGPGHSLGKLHLHCWVEIVYRVPEFSGNWANVRIRTILGGDQSCHGASRAMSGHDAAFGGPVRADRRLLRPEHQSELFPLSPTLRRRHHHALHTDLARHRRQLRPSPSNT